MWDPNPRVVTIGNPFVYNFDRIELVPPPHSVDTAHLWKSGSVSVQRRIECNLTPSFDQIPLFFTLRGEMNRSRYDDIPLDCNHYTRFNVKIDQ